MALEQPDIASPGAAPIPAGRVLVVGAEAHPGALAERVRQALPVGAGAPSVHQVEGYLLALGDIGTNGPPGAVVVQAAGLDGEAATVAGALRELAPGARLVLLAEADEEPVARAAVGAGFDEYLIEPVPASVLARALTGLRRAKAAAPRVAGAGDGDHGKWGAAIDQGFPRLGPAVDGGGAGGFPTLEGVGLRPAPLPSVVEARGSGSDTPLGDIDLVEHLLDQGRGLGGLAARLVAEQANLPGAGWAKDRAHLPAGHVAVPLTHQGQELGFLHAPPPAAATALVPWAQWLARWLALEGRLTGLWELAFRDELTGAWNRRYFRRFLDSILARARTERFRVTLLVFDIDDFKTYNDRFGHAAGDEILRETARLMQSVVRDHDVVARIGGDEFAVIFWDAGGPRRPHSEHPADVVKAARRFQQAVQAHKFPKLGAEAPGTLTVSGGLAGYPWDGQTAEHLLERADQMALQSKREGKNAITYGAGALRAEEGGDAV